MHGSPCLKERGLSKYTNDEQTNSTIYRLCCVIEAEIIGMDLLIKSASNPTNNKLIFVKAVDDGKKRSLNIFLRPLFPENPPLLCG